MINKFTFTVFMFLSILGYSGLTLAKKTNIKNESDIRVSKSKKYLPSICKSEKINIDSLKKLRLKMQTLTQGVKCVAGDFDGNGYLDFFIYGKFHDPGNNIVPYPESFLTLLFHKGKITHSLFLKNLKTKHVLSDPVLYPATNKKGMFGEPASLTDGIIQHGEGGATYVLLYDKKLKRFKLTVHSSEHH